MKAEEILAEFRQIFENRHQRCQGLKDRENKRFIGWVCTYVPEEIIHAAGFVPVRVLGGTGDTPTADAHLYSNLCSFVRNALEEVFRNNYDYLEGMVAMNACDHIRRLYDVWSIYLKDKTPFTTVLSVPGKISENAVAVYTEELGVFKERLEVHFGVKITEEALRRSIALYNTTRSLLQEIYALRKSDTPPLTGAEAMEIFLAGMVMPKEEYNEKLRQILEALKSRSVPHTEDRIRLMVMGSELQEPNFIKVIEDLGGLVVNDDLCNGTRHFWGLVNPEGDPLAALARRYVHKSPCPRIRPHDERVRRLKEIIREYNVQGVIYEVMKFCDMHGAAYPIIKRAMAEIDVPILKLEREHQLAALGQIKTRTQAFFESISLGV